MAFSCQPLLLFKIQQKQLIRDIFVFDKNNTNNTIILNITDLNLFCKRKKFNSK